MIGVVGFPEMSSSRLLYELKCAGSQFSSCRRKQEERSPVGCELQFKSKGIIRRLEFVGYISYTKAKAFRLQLTWQTVFVAVFCLTQNQLN